MTLTKQDITNIENQIKFLQGILRRAKGGVSEKAAPNPNVRQTVSKWKNEFKNQ